MTFKFSSLALLATLTTGATAQTATAPTATAPKKPVAHRTTAATAAKPKPAAPVAPVANPADNPPNVPQVVGAPKPLYALRYIDTVIGTGPIAEPRKYYTVHYTGWLTDGTKFDSSVDRGTPITFPYGARQVIPGWDTGFEGMHVGGKRRLYIPYQLAYGESGRPPVIPAKADLIFDIELVNISDTPPQPKPEPKPEANPEAKPSTDPAAKPETSAPAGSPPPEAQPKTPPHPEGL
ncbi:MAG TPA: FKBP-type peptidyl-prolyl cis-trans isomerase [Edaphobacter sp.]|nr:FKBP-type peptidyl-prolyl cis-trans isomerase [Edaphobacter sp.]